MIIETTLDTEYFLSIVKQLEFKPNDEKEAREILYPKVDATVYDVFISAPNRWAEHYLIKDENKNNAIVCAITLDLNNNLHYFVTTDLDQSNSLSFVKTIKALVKSTIALRHVVFVTTRTWYKEAIKFNKLIGFKIIRTSNGKGISTWFYSKNKGY